MKHLTDTETSVFVCMLLIKCARFIIDIQMTIDYDEGKFKTTASNTLIGLHDTFKKKYGYINQAVNALAFLTEMIVILLSLVLN